jgi:alpha-glucosidase
MTGAPVMRPLWFEYPEDERTYLNEDQYLVGRDLLVAPVVTEGATKRRVYFPSGDRWVDWWTGRRYAGGTEAEVEAPLSRLPLFVRAGAALPTQPVVQHTGEMAKLPLTILLALGADGNNGFYEDAGEGYAHRDGASRTTQVKVTDNQIAVTRAGRDAAARRQTALELLGVGAAPPSLLLNQGAAVRPEKFDAAAGRLVVPLPDAVTFTLKIQP